MKIDMSKAYGPYLLLFLLRMLRALGFNEAWCGPDIPQHLQLLVLWVLWDGSSFGHFKSNQGVRQGDPLSPTLFIICMEVFSRMLQHQVSSKRIYPFFIKKEALVVNHLLYADDMLIFTNGSEISMNRLMSLIKSFYASSGQQLNSSKSLIFFDQNIPPDRKKTLLTDTNFSEGSFPTTYLGAPLFPGRVKIEYFQALEDKVRARINGWTRNMISMGGRITIIEAVLTP
ncbi:unnamed protein product [Rhodiola kirilowii]